MFIPLFEKTITNIEDNNYFSFYSATEPIQEELVKTEKKVKIKEET